VPIEEELERVLPVVDALAGHVRVSIDTRKREVAEAALDAGATIVNDVSASLYDVAAVHEAGWVAMHMRGTPLTMQQEATYDDVVSEVREFLLHRVRLALAAGVTEIWIDPGLGFAKTVEHNLSLLARLDELVATGHPVLVGASRKSFIGRLTGDAPVEDRFEGSLATAVWAMQKGAAMLRVHDVRATVQAAQLVAA
jgi:dihydropteroate synthase